MKTFNRFPKVEDFTCDNCRVRFYEKTAYSVARNWGDFDYYPTYCINCVKANENQPKKPDKRTLNKTGRIHQFGTRVRKDFLKKLKKLARQEKLKYVEVLERALDYYGERNKK